MATERKVELDKSGRPVRVYHATRNTAHTHPFLAVCGLCRKQGWSVEHRRQQARLIREVYSAV